MVLISDMGKMRLREVRDDTRGPITVTRRWLRLGAPSCSSAAPSHDGWVTRHLQASVSPSLKAG